ncbi:MAG TPA: AMP-binding protein [Smithellaceae bacterium]|nr:AMP-binding protein [Smithellaceae bacterium]HRS88488.1 AMP-binding protein [Smithellaceae bacterium]HRV25544.1 AMP-binding protein [Smithellaceae bacterium]
MSRNQFWRLSYDAGITDLDPREWEISYVDAIKDTFDKYSHQMALSFMGTRMTLAQLEQHANRFANMLLSHGLKKGDVVGINLPNIPEYIISWLGTLKAGCVASGVSPLLSTEEMEHQLKDSDARALVTLDAIFAGRLVHIAEGLNELKLVIATNVGDFMPYLKRTLGKLLKKIPQGKVTDLTGKYVLQFKEIISPKKYPADPPPVKVTPDDIAFLQYTGGTTGLPKGAMISHRNCVANLFMVQKWGEWKKGVGLALSGFPFFHLAGTFFAANAVYLGWPQVLIPNPRDTRHICKEIKKFKPTHLINVPSLFQMLIANPRFKKLDHSRLQDCVSGAAPFPEESQLELEKIVGKGKLLEVYGMTETSPITTMNPVKGKRKLGSIGLPIINTDIRLLDPLTGKEVPVGEPGEICVKGPQVMVGYYKKPEETKNVIDEDGYLHTGDIAIQDEEGYLRLVDRSKDMIIVSGFKVFSKKVEDVLTRHPAVESAALVGIPDPQRPGSELVKAYIMLAPGYEQQDEEALKADILKMAAQKLSRYDVPKIIEFRKELPLTSVGKINKKLLRAEARAGN